MEDGTVAVFVKAENLGKAIDSVIWGFDGIDVKLAKCGSLEEHKNFLDDMRLEPDHIKTANEILREAEQYSRAKNYIEAGNECMRASLIFRQELTADMLYYNFTLRNYDIPDDTAGWYFIPVDFYR